MKKSYGKIAYEVALFELVSTDILTMSSDRENAYLPSTGDGGIFKPFEPRDDDDD